jgi:tRNA modification GTPase
MGGIAVITLSGPGAQEILEQVFEPIKPGPLRDADRLRLGHLIGPEGPVDQVLICPGGDVIEINLHGGQGVAATAMALLRDAGAVPAPADGADPVLLARAAHVRLQRELLQAITRCRSPLALETICAQQETGLADLARRALDRVDDQLREELRRAADRGPLVRKLLDGFEIVLIGPPNAGKSALANALTGREVSIVHDQPGTTRDWVREEAIIARGSVWITDTAGLWTQATGIDAQAVQRARHRTESADLVCLVSPGAEAEVPRWLDDVPVLAVASKCDLIAPSPSADAAVSAITGEGLDGLREQIARRLGLEDWDADLPAAVTERQQDLLNRAADADEPGPVIREMLS